MFNDSTVMVDENVISARDGKPYKPSGSYSGWNQITNEHNSFKISQRRLFGNVKTIEDPKN